MSNLFSNSKVNSSNTSARTKIAAIIEDALIEAYRANQFTSDEAIAFLTENSSVHTHEQAKRIVESWNYA